MFEVKQSAISWVPVRLLDAGGAGIAGVAATAVELGVLKSDGTYAFATLTAPNWSEVTGGPATGAGLYRVRLSAAQTDTTGPLAYVVKSTTSERFVGSIKVVAREEAETYALAADAHDEAFGKWEIFTSGPDANRLVLYRADGVTVLKKFDLTNALGAPSTINPFKRTPV
jgi:hypothetical protein